MAMRSPLAVAVAQPVCFPFDVERNADEHATLIRRSDARLIVFPELSLTGYQFEATPVMPDDGPLAPIIDACAETGAIALVGAPVVCGNDTYIGMLRIDASGGAIAYRKGALGTGEQARFTPGDDATVMEIDGWRVGLGICKDTGTTAHIEGVAALGIDLYAAGLLHHHHELDEQDARAVRIARACQSYVAFASFAGQTGEGYDVTAGNSSIWDDRGRRLARADDRPGEVVLALLRRQTRPSLSR